MSLHITQHFGLSEFACHDGTPYPAEWIADRLHPLCVVLEAIREACGGHPVEIVSGFRTLEHNANVGGAARSQHVQGRAADIAVDGIAPSEVHAAILTLFGQRKIEIGGLGIYRAWVHVDVRPRAAEGRLMQWTGSKVGDEVA